MWVSDRLFCAIKERKEPRTDFSWIGSHPFVIASLIIFAISFPSFLYSQALAARPIMPLYLISKAPRANLILANSIASLLSNAILFNM